MAGLIGRLRQLVGDQVSPERPPKWSDEELQAVLDRHRSRWFDLELTPEPDVTGLYLNFSANGRGNWEGDTVGVGYSIRDGSLTARVPSSHDLAVGWWTFAASTDPPLYLTGYSYDLFGAAAEVLSMEAASGKASVKSFSADGFTVQMEDRTQEIVAMFGARQGGGEAWGTVPLQRNDGPRTNIIRERSF